MSRLIAPLFIAVTSVALAQAPPSADQPQPDPTREMTAAGIKERAK